MSGRHSSLEGSAHGFHLLSKKVHVSTLCSKAVCRVQLLNDKCNDFATVSNGAIAVMLKISL